MPHQGMPVKTSRTPRPAVDWKPWRKHDPRDRLHPCNRQTFSARLKMWRRSPRLLTSRARCSWFHCRSGVAGNCGAAAAGGHRRHGSAIVRRTARLRGALCGVIATREQYVRQMPGRLVGQTTDRNGKRGFVLTLATREQHIRREKATSNICTNQALVALMANIFMTVYGKAGLRELAKQNLAKTAYAAARFGKHATVLFAGAPRFNEFVCRPAKIPAPSTAAFSGTRSWADFPCRSSIPNWEMPPCGAARR